MQGLPVATTGSTVIRSNRMESVLSHDTSGITPVISRSHQLGENAHTVDVPGSGFSVKEGRLRHSTTENAAAFRRADGCYDTNQESVDQPLPQRQWPLDLPPRSYTAN
jgi:hypothetical protein